MIAFEDIRRQMTADPENGAAYSELGDYYYSNNVNQAYLCYEHAYYRSHGVAKEELKAKMEACRESEVFRVNPIAFVILSYNSKAIMEKCLNAIRSTCDEGTYEVVVIDSASTDGVREWLLEQKNIKIALNDKFPGFAAGCNQGANLAEPSYDIMLLNNDAIVTPHAVFYLRLGLYSDDKIGAAGPVSNNAISDQLHSQNEHSQEDWFEIAHTVNLPSENGIQRSNWLQGYALLI